MTHSKLFGIFILSMLMLVGCGGGASAPEAAARNWINALIAADTKELQKHMCRTQAAMMSRTLMTNFPQRLAGESTSAAINIDASGLTYTYNQATQSVTISGRIRVHVLGNTIERSLDQYNLNVLPVVQEDGTWKVCLRVF